MKTLTPKQRAFVAAYTETGNASEAYRRAYNAKRMSADAIKVEASRLLAHPIVALTLAGLEKRVIDKVVATTGVSKSWVIAKLVENVERAMQAKPVLDAQGNPTGDYTYNGNVANRALELIGKEQGMFIERKEVGKPGDFDNMSDSDLDAFIQQEARELLAQTKRSATKH